MAASAAHLTKVYAKASSAAPGASDEVDGLDDYSLSKARDVLEVTTFKDTSGAKKRILALKDGSISLSGNFESADAPQKLIRSSHDSAASIWIQIESDPSAGAGDKGFQVECLVESFEVKGGVDGKAEFSASLTFNAAPVAV